MEFYVFRMILRSNYGSNHIFLCCTLFHQWGTDMYAKIETERLNYIWFNKKKLRADEYIHLWDALAIDVNPNNLGNVWILPSTFTGSPRHQHKSTQDAMTYVRKYSRPHLFITFICNLLWSDILKELIDEYAQQIAMISLQEFRDISGCNDKR